MSEKMKALVYYGKDNIKLVERDIPKIMDPKDAIVKVTASSICASDLHILNGGVPRAKENIILGHEFCGEVVAIGDDIKKVKIGDRVSANVETFCGECFFCKRGYINNCIHGGWELGCRIDGCQTEYVRVPFADNGLNLIPDSLTYKDTVLVGDVLASGYFGAELADIRPGDTVAIIGAGPVGLTAMMSCRLFGPANIIAIDIIDERLKCAKDNNLADITINPKNKNIEEIILSLTDGRGADAVLECAGGRDTFQTAWKIARPNAVVSVIAMYEDAQTLPLHQMYGKNLIFKTGGVDARHSDELIKLIEYGKIDTTPLMTHTYSLDNILEAYDLFKNKPKECIKVLITP